MTVTAYLILLGLWSVVSTAGLVLSLVATNPLALGPLGVTLWFIVLFLSLSSTATLFFYAVKTYLRLHPTGAGRLRYSWRQGLLAGGWLAGMLSLSSLHQLGLLDGILLALLLVIVEVYVRFRWP